MRVGLLNATGYTGAEVIRFASGHPEFVLVGVTARSQAGQTLGAVLPWVRASPRPAYADLVLTPELNGSFDLIVSCLPHEVSAEKLAPFIASGVPAVDVSPDFRLQDLAEHRRWYGEHHAPQHRGAAEYGLTETHRAALRHTKLVANPGCHAITAELALVPALAAGLVAPNVIVDSKTGVSGAGRSAALEFGFSEVNENARPYKVAAHRHGPEIAQELTRAAGRRVEVTFVPTLVPMSRGILTTAYATLRDGVTPAAVAHAYHETYDGEQFVHVVDEPPQTKWTTGTNHCFVSCVVDEANRVLVAMAATDNLGKGAAGGALQNANVMLGLDESAGLGVPPSYP
ncbi:MAG: N-acetyl-gamma-glutamyl-phosphate reductase [Actinobacteria bacterium]|nr:N-acetyl-gamma-glutamyl-phosphate reductase [Actinomycetota bacterium]